MDVVVGQGSCGTGQGSVESHILRARLVLTWKNVGTETPDGESAILQWIVNEGHLLESGDLKTAFLSGDPDPAHKGSDALYIDPPSDLKRWLKLGPEEVLRLRKAVCGLVNAPLRWHQRLSRALRQAGFVSLQMDPVKHVSPVDVPTKLKAAITDSSVSPVPETHMDRWKRQRSQVCWESMLTIWLVVEILFFRKLCNGFGLNLNLEPGNKVDVDFVVEKCQDYNPKSIKIFHVKVCSRDGAHCCSQTCERRFGGAAGSKCTFSISWRCWSAAMAAVARKSTPVVYHWNLAEQVCDSQRSSSLEPQQVDARSQINAGSVLVDCVSAVIICLAHGRRRSLGKSP